MKQNTHTRIRRDSLITLLQKVVGIATSQPARQAARLQLAFHAVFCLLLWVAASFRVKRSGVLKKSVHPFIRLSVRPSVYPSVPRFSRRLFSLDLLFSSFWPLGSLPTACCVSHVALRANNQYDSYIRSLCMAIKWDAKGGKSGATFSKTADERFVVKYITKTELQMFNDCAAQWVRLWWG